MPKSKSFVCKKCGRAFSMAAHLARHGRVHAPIRSKNAPQRASKPSQAGRASTGQFAALIADLGDSHRNLISERGVLDAQIAAIETALAAMGSNGPSQNRRAVVRGPAEYRPGSLKDRIQRVLAGTRAPMPVSEVTAAVLRSGFKSKNKTLSTTVGIALADMSGVRRVTRGMYAMS